MNHHLSIYNEQLTIKKNRINQVFSLLIVFCSLFIVACEGDPGFMQRIDDEIAWSNAARLTVRLDYHPNWGSSNPVRGTLAPGNMDIRKKYSFSLDFTPAPAYSLVEWIAYETSKLPSGWHDNINSLIDENKVSDVVLPQINPNGGTFKFTIDSEIPVTLIPICRTQPRVLRTEPEDDPNPEKTLPRGTPIIIHFNAQINEETLIFGDDLISIKDGDGSNLSGHFNAPVYTELGGLYFVTITPKGENLPPFDTKIIVSAGKDIANLHGNKMANNAKTFSWYTMSSLVENPRITFWSAEYDDIRQEITVSFSRAGGTRIEAFYRENRGGNFPLENGVIPSTRIDAAGIKDGRTITKNIEYTITINLYTGQVIEDTVSFKIWNYPGMKTEWDSRTIPITEIKITEINTAAQLAAITWGTTGQYVLTNDIEVEDHTPIGMSRLNIYDCENCEEEPCVCIDSFRGRFYGNGHMITVTGDFSDAKHTGLFGYVQDAEIRDLIVRYNSPAAINNATHVGGLAGYAAGNTKLKNIIVSGEINVSGDIINHFGGITGELNGQDTLIENVYSSLNMRLSNNTDYSTEINVGGIAGYVENGSVRDCVWALNTDLIIRECNSPLNLGGIAGTYYSDVTGTDSYVPTLERANAFGNITVSVNNVLRLGGITGLAYSTVSADLYVKNTLYEYGTINVTIDGVYIDNDITNIGGIFGYMGKIGEKGPSVSGNRPQAANIKVSYLRNGDLYMGGYAGWVLNTNIKGEYSGNSITVIESPNVSWLVIGGFIGYIEINNEFERFEIEDCHSSSSLFINTNGSVSVDIGGLIGYIYVRLTDSSATHICSICSGSSHVLVNQCSASGDIVIKTGLKAYTGGLLGYTRFTEINQSKTTGNVIISAGPGRTSEGNGNAVNTNDHVIYAGGLVGYASNRSSIKNSYALGNVEVDDPFITASHSGAGGLVGRARATVTIEHCFAKGNVIAQSATRIESDVNTRRLAVAGGLVGFFTDANSPTNGPGIIRNCVVLSEFIIAKGFFNSATNNNRDIRRIFVPRYNTTDITASNNYALNVMNVLVANSYLGTLSAHSIGATGATTPNGANVTHANLVTSAWWTNAARGFTEDKGWSMTGIARGYPRLAWEFER